MEYETVPLQQLLREIAGRTASEQDADAISLAADSLDALSATPKENKGTKGWAIPKPIAWAVTNHLGEYSEVYLSEDDANDDCDDRNDATNGIEGCEVGSSVEPLIAEGDVAEMLEEIDECHAVIEEMMDADESRDAARYRWLIKNISGDIENGCYRENYHWSFGPIGEWVDTQIRRGK